MMFTPCQACAQLGKLQGVRLKSMNLNVMLLGLIGPQILLDADATGRAQIQKDVPASSIARQGSQTPNITG